MEQQLWSYRSLNVTYGTVLLIWNAGSAQFLVRLSDGVAILMIVVTM